MTARMVTVSYKAPSNVAPSLLVTGLALLYPILLARRIYTTPAGIHGLQISYTVFWLLVYVLQLRYHTIPFFTTPLNALPRPSEERFIIGCIGSPIEATTTYTRWFRMIPNDGLIYVRTLLHMPYAVLPTSPTALNEILNTHSYNFEKPRVSRRFLTRVLGTGLVVAEGAVHKGQRRAVAPAFQGRHIRELVPLFWAKSQQMVEAIGSGKAARFDRISTAQPDLNQGNPVDEKGSKQMEVEIGGIASRATLDIIGKAGFGRDFNTIENSDDELAKQYDTILDPQRVGGYRLILYFLVNALFPIWFGRVLPWKMNQRINQAAYDLRGICRRLISDKKRVLKQEKETGASKTDGEIDILSVLLRKEEIDDDGLVDQMLTFLAAGHETTAGALTWCTYVLSVNPTCQDRLRSELEASSLAEPGAKVTAETIDNLPYLAAVCAETLRLYPVVGTTVRTTLRDIRILGQVIPKGIEIIISPWAMNRHPGLWGDDADDFRPDRWLQDSSDKTGEKRMNTYDFLTFLHGPRSCIGQGFAKSELKCLLAALVLRFQMELAEPGFVAVPVGIVTLKPRGGMKLRLTELSH